MLVIGLTGGIGSGKSTVANLFAQRGIPVIDTDIIAREVTKTSEPALHQIASYFGEIILHSDGTLDRNKLKEIIFDDPAKRRWLEALLHPIILERVGQLIASLKTPYCIVVIPLLYETNPTNLINRVVVIDTPEDKQKERVMTRDNLKPAMIEAIMKTQISRKARLEKADDVITNNGSKADLEHQVQILHKQYLALAAKQSSRGNP